MNARNELGTLEASGLIEIAALEPELEYLFRHALVQEAAYASLLKQDRKALHRAAADAIISAYPQRENELAGVIAMHLEHAGDTGRAGPYLITAGEHALERFANQEAMQFFARAGEIADESSVDLRLQSAIGVAKAGWSFNQAGDDVERLESAVAGSERADQVLVAEAYFWIAFLRRQRGETPETSPELERATKLAAEVGKTLGDPAAAALPRALLGSFVAFTGGLREGARDMREALESIKLKGDPVSIAMVSDFLALTYSRLGEFAMAEETIAHARTASGTADAISRLDVDIARASLDLERGDSETALSKARECSERAEGLGAFACVVASNVMFGAAALAREDAPGAKVPLERGDELSLVTNMAAMRTLIHGLLGSTRALMGDLPGGVEGWDAALANARVMGDRYGEAQTLWGRGRTYARTKEWSTALPDLDRAVTLFEEMEARPSLARALHDRAEVLGGLDRAGESDADERRSRELARELGLRDSVFA